MLPSSSARLTVGPRAGASGYNEHSVSLSRSFSLFFSLRCLASEKALPRYRQRETRTVAASHLVSSPRSANRTPGSRELYTRGRFSLVLESEQRESETSVSEGVVVVCKNQVAAQMLLFHTNAHTDANFHRFVIRVTRIVRRVYLRRPHDESVEFE